MYLTWAKPNNITTNQIVICLMAHFWWDEHKRVLVKIGLNEIRVPRAWASAVTLYIIHNKKTFASGMTMQVNMLLCRKWEGGTFCVHTLLVNHLSSSKKSLWNKGRCCDTDVKSFLLLCKISDHVLFLHLGNQAYKRRLSAGGISQIKIRKMIWDFVGWASACLRLPCRLLQKVPFVGAMGTWLNCFVHTPFHLTLLEWYYFFFQLFTL